MHETILNFLRIKQFRELESFIDEHQFDVSTPVTCVFDERQYFSSPFYEIAFDEGDLQLVKFILSKNVIPRVFRRHNGFIEACRDGCLGVVEFFLQNNLVSEETKNHALWFISLDFEVKNKNEIINALIKHGAQKK